jgi:hypothetical protein
MSRVKEDGVEFLGCGIGGQAFIKRLLQKKIESVSELQQKILLLDDAQMQLCLLRSCASSCKVINFLRCSDPRDCTRQLEVLDNTTLETLEKIICLPLSELACKQAVLPVRLGGLGLISAAHTSPSAFIGSVDSTRELTTAILNGEGSGDDVSGIDFAKDLFPRDSTWSQSSLTAKCHQELFEDLFVSSKLPDQARLRSLCGKFASAWLLAVPSFSLGLKMTNDQFQCLLRLRLGLAVYSCQRLCPLCRRAPLDVLEHHSLACGSGGDRIMRHNIVRDCLFSMCQTAGLCPRKEERHPDSSFKPGDVFIPTWSLGRPAALDVSITSPLQAATLERAAGSDGHAGEVRFQEKTNKYAAVCANTGIHFIPIVAETFGRFCPESLACLTKIARMWGSRCSLSPSVASSFFFQSLSFALQRGNAEMLLRRSPLFEGLNSPVEVTV